MSNPTFPPDPSDSFVLHGNIPRKSAKTSSERSRAYRERQRAHKQPKAPPKSAAERVREWRARQKFRLASENPTYDPLGVPINPLESSSSSSSTSTPALKSIPMSLLKNVRIVSVSSLSPYRNFATDKKAHAEFQRQFLGNPFGYTCTICDSLCFKNHVKHVDGNCLELLQQEYPDVDVSTFTACASCRRSLKLGVFPKFAKINGFSYPKIPENLPNLDLVSERLISPHLPFAQIRRLRHTKDCFENYAQILNVPVFDRALVKKLPRSMDHCINVNIQDKRIQETKQVLGSVERHNMRRWLEYLMETPLYKQNKIKMDESYFNNAVEIKQEQVSENISAEESLLAQQQTLLWSDINYFQTRQADLNILHYYLFEADAEELSFPSIYLGHPRVFSSKLNSVTPLMALMSEVRRSDRRGVAPEHLLFMALKLMTLKVRGSLPMASRPITADPKKSTEDFLNKFIESNKTFLKSIPNSPWHWTEKSEDLLAMIRQMGRPTFSLIFEANERGWTHLLQILFKCRNGCEISEESVAELTPLEKSTLINQDAVTCAIYFNALFNVLMSVLQSKKCSPFEEYRVVNFYKRMEFPHNGSPRVHVLLWLNKAPKDPIGVHKLEAIRMIDKLLSVSRLDAMRNIELQVHKHGPMCSGKVFDGRGDMCQHEAPFMPCRETLILEPMDRVHPGFDAYALRFKRIRENLKKTNYPDMRTFYAKNQILSDAHYVDILRAGINRPTVFVKRTPYESWNLGFSPFILNVINSGIDMEFILDDYSCAKHVIRYVDQASKGMSDLRSKIIDIASDSSHPEFDTKVMADKLGANLLKTMEMTTAEAAWYLLKEPMCTSSCKIVYIPTVRPENRLTSKRSTEEGEDGFVEDTPEVLKGDFFTMYIERAQHLEDITLAQFVSYHISNTRNECGRNNPGIIRYRNYDRDTEPDEYKREMVTLHLPFRCEEWEILLDNKFLELYDANEEVILQRRTDFEKDLDVKMKIVDICKELRETREKIDEAEMVEFFFEDATVKIEPMDEY